jgi:TM2 domain-containing membrane protein YozV
MTATPTTIANAPLVVRLRNPAIAALLGWLVPGAGHLYQGRTAKGILFLVSILSTFFYGLYLGDGKVVYASWRAGDTRWAYVCQIGVGLAALPALVQANRPQDGDSAGFMAPPELQRVGQIGGGEGGELGLWNRDLNRYFELGTVYTMIAGLLNILAIYDAFAGPVESGDIIEEDEKSTPAGAAA